MAQTSSTWNADRTETALQSIIDTDGDDATRALSDKHVAISVAEPATANCQHALFTAVNLFARLDPVISNVTVHIPTDAERTVYVPGLDTDTVSTSIEQLAELIASPVTVTATDTVPDDPDATLQLGDGPMDPTVAIGSDGWLAHVATTDTCPGFSTQVNPVGSYTAACMGCAEAFKHLLRTSICEDNHSVQVSPIDSTTFSTYSYTVDPATPANPELPSVVNINNLNVIGVGAGGGALIQTLSAVQTLTGSVRLVDSDEVSQSNLNRYIWAYNRDVGDMKSDIGKQVLTDAHPGLIFAVRSHPKPYMDFSDEIDTDSLELVISTVDTVRGRKQIQWDLPETILDAATNQQGDYVVLRVAFGDGQCLACKHQGREDGVEREMAVLSDQIGLDTDTLVRMNTNNDAFTEDQITQINEHVDDTAEITVPEAGDRFSDWFRQHCGHIDLGGANMEVPVPFLPVTAGVLLAGEVIKHRHFPDAQLENRFTHNMLGQPRDVMHRYTNPHDDCAICGDPDAVDLYEAKWEKSGKAALVNHINDEYPANRSANGQAAVIEYLYKQDALPGTDPDIRTRQILDNVPVATRTHIENLVDEVGLLDEHEPRGGRSYIFHERTEERIYDDLEPILNDEIERLLDHVEDDEEVRTFVAALLDIDTDGLDPDETVEAIRNRFFDIEEVLKRMDLFDEVAQEIEAADVDKQEYQYGPIGWRRASNRYTLTQQAVDLYEGVR